jgi:hypothetical protein
MLSRPFRGMGRGRLIVILIVLLLVEAVGGAGIYVNNHQAEAAQAPQPMHKPAAVAGPAMRLVHNYPRTVVVGKTETFSVRLPELADKRVTYVVAYPDGSVDQVEVQTDASGFSQHTFLIQYKPNDRREAIGIDVYYMAHKRAFTQFAVQLPTRQARP